MDIHYIIKIQSVIRRFLVRRNNVFIPSSKYQTKQWRQNRNWYINGRKNECEINQIKIIEKIINQKCEKTHDRINIETLQIIENKRPMMAENGFEWTENFDGKININKNKLCYFNLKFVCDEGGAQTRTLREVYHFIKYQLEHIKKYKTTTVYFINILDGDSSYLQINKFLYLINKKKYKDIRHFVFCGDMFLFQKWFYKFGCKVK